MIQDKLGIFNIDWYMCCVGKNNEPHFRNLVEQCAYNRIGELGTYKGVSTAVLSEYADEVRTLDIMPDKDRQKIWDYLGISNIKSYVIQTQKERDEQLLDIAQWAELMFIDGGHLANDILVDEQLTRECKYRIFDDASVGNSWKDVRNCLDNLPDEFEVTYLDRFALVTRVD